MRALFLALFAGAGATNGPRAALATETPIYETVVVATPAQPETPREDCAASASVITADRTPRAAETVTELLSEQAGAVVTRLGGLGSMATISLRGSSANQVSVYLDGVPINTPTGGGVDLGAIPIGDIERIEIYRGMSPMAFGASAIGGVVSITTATPTTNRVQLAIGGGSFGTTYGDASAAWSRGRFHLYAGLHGMTSDGDFPYVDTQNTTLTTADDHSTHRLNNDFHQVDGTVRAVVDLTSTRRLGASVRFFDRDQGLPGPLSLTNPQARLGTSRVTALLGYQSENDLGAGGGLRASVYGNFDRTRFQDVAHQLSPMPTDTHDRLATTGATLTWRKAARPWLILSGIVDGRYDRFTPSDALQSGGAPGTRWSGAVGVESDLWFEAIHLDVIPSLRLEMARSQTSGRDSFNDFLPTAPAVNFVEPIARLSLMKTVTSWLSLRANGGRYARLPSLIELYGNTGYLVGNTALEPERGLNADVGPAVSWRGPQSRVVWSAAAFASFVDDIIQYQFGNGHARAANLASARILGVESDATAELGQHVKMFIAVTLSDPRNSSDIAWQHDRQLPLRPRYRIYARPEGRAFRLGRHATAGVYADCDVTGGNTWDLPNSARIPARVLFGAGAYAQLPAGFSLRFSALNITNAAVNDIVNYPLPGRALYVSVAWSMAREQTVQPFATDERSTPKDKP